MSEERLSEKEMMAEMAPQELRLLGLKAIDIVEHKNMLI